MITSIAKTRKDVGGQPIEGWSAELHPAYPYLLSLLQELEKIEKHGVVEIGSDYEDEPEDSLGIVWAGYAYFSEYAKIGPAGRRSARDVWAWVTVDFVNARYYGSDINGQEWHVFLSDPNAQRIAAEKLLALPE
jgi:hypothetical protein